MKLLHTADLHLDSPLRSLALRDSGLRAEVQTASRAALERIVDAAIAENVAAVLISGDLFDGKERSARTGAFVVQQMERLRSHGIRGFYIKGNHDAENPLTGALTLPENVHVFSGRGAKVELAPGVYIHGVSFSGKHAPQSLLPKFPAPVQGATNIAMLHTSLSGAAGHDPYAPCTLAELTQMGFDYWALGHVHQREVHAQAPWVVMPGMPQGRDMGELGPKSATLITLSDQIRISEVPTSAVEFQRLVLDVTGVSTQDDLRDRVRARLRDAARDLGSTSLVLRLTLQGRTALRWQLLRDHDLWSELTAELARDAGPIWIDKLVLDLASPDAPGAGAADELAAIMAAIREEPSFQEACQAEIEAIRQELPASRRQARLPDEEARDALARRLAFEGAERFLAKMRGGGH